jgi:hypothetical protein
VKSFLFSPVVQVTAEDMRDNGKVTGKSVLLFRSKESIDLAEDPQRHL